MTGAITVHVQVIVVTMASQCVWHLYLPRVKVLIGVHHCMAMANQLLPTCRIALFGDNLEQVRVWCSVTVYC